MHIVNSVDTNQTAPLQAAWPQGYKVFHAQLGMNIFLLINVKMPTIVGILIHEQEK